jgi:predicted permease
MEEEHHINQGLNGNEARQAALRNFGGVDQIKEHYRDRFRFSAVENVLQDLGYAFRTLRIHPGFAIVVILTLAIGIGSSMAIFSLINTLMLRMLPVREPQRLVELLSRFPGEPRTSTFAWEHYEHFRDDNHVFSVLIGFSPARLQLSADGLHPEVVEGEYVVGDFFPDLGVKPAIGRLIEPQDDRQSKSGTAVAVVSWTYWKTRFNLNPAIIGKNIVLGDVEATVIGVTPRGFVGLDIGSRPDVWVPVSITQRPGQPENADLQLTLIGRLKPDVSIEKAKAEMIVLNQRRVEDLARRSPDPLTRQIQIELEPAGAGVTRLRDSYAKPLLTLMAVVSLLLLTACTNVAGMLLARSAARRHEIALRVSLGAGRLRLMQQVLTESLLISVMGTMAGILIAWGGADVLVQIIASGRLREPILIQVEPDTHTLLFAAGTALMAGVLCGLAPAFHAYRGELDSSLKERRLFGKTLVVTQVAVSVVLLSAAGLFANHLSKLRGPDLGFQRDSVLLVTLDPPAESTREQLSQGYRELLNRLKMIPAVRSVSLSAVTPIQGPGSARFANVEGYSDKPEDRRYLTINWVAPKYFETLGIPLLGGRDFGFEDEGRPRVAIVNLAMAQYYFGKNDPLGKHVTFVGEKLPYEIVGVVGDSKYYEPGETAPRTIFLDTFQYRRMMSDQFVLRTNVAPAAVANDVRRAVSDVSKNIPIARVTTLAEQVDASIVPERLIAILSELFGTLGAAMAALGLYGLVVFTVTRRTREIGVRMALGATRSEVALMVLKDAIGLVLAGLALGTPIALWSKHFARGLIQNLRLESELPIAFAVVTMIAVPLFAAYIPARWASRIEPTEALRHE